MFFRIKRNFKTLSVCVYIYIYIYMSSDINSVCYFASILKYKFL